jgi:hypothetical protein
MTSDYGFTTSGFIDEDGAAAYLADNLRKSPSAATLRRWRRINDGSGPKWKKVGRFVWYHKNDLDEWLFLNDDSKAA